MEERGGGDLLERLGPYLAASVIRCLDDPADLVRLASVSKSCSRFIITNGFCKMLCLRMTPEISCFVRAIEVGSSSSTVEVGPNFSAQWQTSKSEHRIYAYLGYSFVSPSFLTDIAVESIAASTSIDRIENMLPNSMRPNMSSSHWPRLTCRLSCKLCVVHEIKIQLPEMFYFFEPVFPPENLQFKYLHFRFGHMRDENATREESSAGSFIWTYVSPEFSMKETAGYINLKLQRPIISIGGILQIELSSEYPIDELPDISLLRVKAIIGCPLAPAFDVSLPDRMGNSILMYFPGAMQHLDVAGLDPSCSLRNRFNRLRAKKTKKRKKRTRMNHA